MNIIDIETAAGVLGLRTRVLSGKVMVAGAEVDLWDFCWDFNPLTSGEDRDFIICRMRFDVTWSDDQMFRLGKGMAGVMVMGKKAFAAEVLADHNSREEALGTALVKALLMTKERVNPSTIPSVRDGFQTSDGGSVAVDNRSLAKYYE